MKSALLLVASHALVALAGFAAGIYLLPILIAPTGPQTAEISALAAKASFTGQFRRDLQGSDVLHWGEGTVSVGPSAVSLMGRLAPGPDYKLYLAPQFVQNEAEFLRIKATSLRIGDVRTFDNFIVTLPSGANPADFTTVVVWCETFREFISAAQYR
ncbi:DM13 domain-containing protein [Hydrogenophaga sp. BPS33]|uniref:DM13 domain-containing protein n=1 Tax=Hydrogenophaga sp. BPS33 TaxID=2651974 RepID=UPI00131FA240|nr:DM13 domain-containing protein [Hydrogenophaga sp. BPS33]QHE83735.1 DM13 domain-containing protein [Hydrogenophaga sp. BPS33]